MDDDTPIGPMPAPTAPATAAPAAPAASSGAAAPIAPIHAANALTRDLHLEARERRVSEGGSTPRGCSGNSAAPSGSGGVATLADLSPSEEQEDHCASCGGIGLQGRNELVRCGFGDGCCIQEQDEAPRRACWHAACEPKLCGKQGQQRVVCARHEKYARLRLDVGASGQARVPYVVLTIDSYNKGEFDPSVPRDEPESDEPPPSEEDLQLESRTPGSEEAVGDAARQRGTPAARSQRAAEKAAAAYTRGSPESTSHPAAASPTSAASTPASLGSPRPAEPPTTPMETDEPHAAPPPTAATADEGGGEGAASADPDKNVTESDLFREDDEEGGGALSSPRTHAHAPNSWHPT